MPDREKVIIGLEEISDYFFDIYRNDIDSYKCAKAQEYSDVAIDAIALLKEQETKTGKWIPIESPTGVEAFGVKEMTVMNVCCSVCGSEEDVSFTGYKYCPRCGAKMKGR